VGVTAAVVPPALAAAQGSHIVGGQSGRCLDVPNSSTTNGTQLQLFDCGSADGQFFAATSTRQLTAGRGSGTSSTRVEVTLGCGTKARRSMSNSRRASERHCASTDRRP